MSFELQSWSLLAMLTVLAGWLIPRYWGTARDLLATSDLGPRALLIGTACVLGLAAYIRLEPLCGSPLPFAADIERLYRLHAFSTWEHLSNPQDYHHPGLWFGLLHWPFELSGRSFLVPAAFGRLCTVLTVPVVGLMVGRYAGRLGALTAMLGAALLPFLNTQARALSDVTLFVLLGALSLYAYARAREQPTLERLLVLAVALGLAANASYAAPVLLAALLAHAVLYPGHRVRLVGALSIAALIGAQRFWHVMQLMPNELTIRSELVRLDANHWANVSLTGFADEAATEFLTSWYAFLLPLIVLALWAGRRLLFRHATELGLTALAYVVFLCFQPFIRVKPYYASLLPVILLALLGSLVAVQQAGEQKLVAARRRVLALLAGAACCLAFALDFERQPPDPLQAYGLAARSVIESARADHATRLASTNWTETILYFFADPMGTMKGCLRHDTSSPCQPEFDYYQDIASDVRFYALAQGPLMFAQPEKSIAKLRSVQAEGVTHLFVHREIAVDAALISYAERACRRLAKAEALEVWRCPHIDDVDATPAGGA